MQQGCRVGIRDTSPPNGDYNFTRLGYGDTGVSGAEDIRDTSRVARDSQELGIHSSVILT